MTTAAQTVYTILRSTPGTSPGVPKLWEVVGSVEAGGARPAVRKWLGTLPADKRDGEFVATPSRSWVPVTVKRREVIDLT